MVAVLRAGLHVPVTPFLEVVGSGVAVAPWHKGPTGSKVGVTEVVTVTLSVVVVPHCPAAGVKV